MTLVSTAKGSTLGELTKMAVGVMEVVSLFIAMVAVPQSTSEVGKLQAKVTSLEKQLSALLITG